MLLLFTGVLGRTTVGCTADSINGPFSACTTLRAPGAVSCLCPASGPGTQTDCVYAAGADLSVGGRASQLLCSLTAGLSRACLVGLTPFALRDDHSSVSAEKSSPIGF